MKLTKEQFITKTAEMAINSGIELYMSQLNNLYLYKEMLVEWNEKINLTAITDDEEIIAKHIIDSLEIVKYIKEGQKIIDVGTGAGLPGIIIAIYFEGIVNITLFDALNKRIIFLNEVIKELGLKDIETIHARSEEYGIKNREKFDIATARAVAPLNILLEYSIPMLKVDGLFVPMKANIFQEILESQNALKSLDSEIIGQIEFELPKELSKRTLIKIRKNKSTKKIFPRKNSDIKKRPL